MILTSLVKGKLLLRDGEKSLGLDAKFTLNEEFTSKHQKLDLKRYMQQANISADRNKKVPENKTLNALTGNGENSTVDEALSKSIEDDRRIVLQASIVKLMKTAQKMTHTELIQATIEDVSHRFNPSISSIKKVIEILIDKQYIERTEQETETSEKSYQYIA